MQPALLAWSIALLLTCGVYCQSMASPAVHFTLKKRGGAFSPNRTADLDYLKEQLILAESRFNLTQREVRGNKVVRAPKVTNAGGGDGGKLIGEIGRDGGWFASLKLGSLKQTIQTDLDMLTADFAITTTSSDKGTKFDDLFSTSYAGSLDHPFPGCSLPHDDLVLPKLRQSFPLTFPHCKPSKQSVDTLAASGGILGLAPSTSLRQIDAPSLIQQLLDAGLIEHEVFSITIFNSEEGLLSLGGTVAESMSSVEERIQTFLGGPAPQQQLEVQDPEQDALDLAHGAPQGMIAGQQGPPGAKREPNSLGGTDSESARDPKPREKRDATPYPRLEKRRKPKSSDHQGSPGWKDQWKWSPVDGAEGWWQTLMRGVWTDGVKVLKNQPCVIDLGTPFILAPPQAAKLFYQSISGSHRLPEPYSSFYAFPCNNPPILHVEFGGWRFPTMRGMKSYDQFVGPHGKFSLGKVTEESGYCVGAVVETKMGVGDLAPLRKGHARNSEGVKGMGALESGMLAGNGMRDVWVLGEPIFRGIGMVFDLRTKQVGFRAY